MPKKSDRQPRGDLRRRQPTRLERQTCLIICGGKSEKAYFEALCRELRLGSAVCVLADGKDPYGLVRRADRIEKGHGQNYDEAWLVLDKDEFAEFEDLASNGRARQGRAKQFGLAFSNPRFELWLLLHFRDWTRDCRGRPLERELNRQPGFEAYEHGTEVFALLGDRRAEATSRAAALRARHAEAGRPPHSCPSTAVDLLVQWLECQAVV